MATGLIGQLAGGSGSITYTPLVDAKVIVTTTYPSGSAFSYINGQCYQAAYIPSTITLSSVTSELFVGAGQTVVFTGTANTYMTISAIEAA